jgi:hypothetical protein
MGCKGVPSSNLGVPTNKNGRPEHFVAKPVGNCEKHIAKPVSEAGGSETCATVSLGFLEQRPGLNCIATQERLRSFVL